VNVCVRPDRHPWDAAMMPTLEVAGLLCAAALNEAQLLVPAWVRLVVLVDDPVAGVASRPRVDTEGRDAEVVPDGPRQAQVRRPASQKASSPMRNACEHPRVAGDAIRIRPARDGDRRALALLLAAVAEEGDGIAAEPPIDVDQLAANWRLEGTLVAVAAGEVVGELRVDPSWMGYGEIGMMVAAGWRGRGVGTALVAAAIEWARARGLHKLALSVFPQNEAAISLYRKFGFVEEGRLTQHVRRANGELWDLVAMGLLL
jgi:ribosomal protein S18 acetylase RimI-like enzyme